MPDMNQMAAQGLADRVMGPPPPGGGAVDPAAVEQVRSHLAEALKIVTSDPQILMAAAEDIKGFVMTIKQFADMGQGAGQPGQPMPGGPPPGGMPPGGGPPMGGPPPGAGPPGMGQPQGMGPPGPGM